MGAFVRSVVEVAAPAEAVWGYVTDWPRQGEWIPFTVVEAGPAAHVGGQVRAWTGIGGLGFWDTMTITSWVPVRDGAGRCEVLHTGAVVRGEGEFSVRGRGSDACTFVWSERLVIPGGPVGSVVWRLVRPLVQRGVDAAMQRMAKRVEESHAAG